MPVKLINRAVLDKTLVGFQTRFAMALENARAAVMWQELAMDVPSGNQSEEYKWGGPVPKMKPWRGDRALARLAAYGTTIVNEPFANGIVVGADDIRFDRLGIFGPKIDALASQAEYHKDELIFALLEAGFGSTKGLAYDGQLFFDTDHKDGGGPTQSNKLDLVFDAAGTALQTAITTMRKFKDENGEPLAITPTHLVVPPALEFTAKKVVNDSLTANGGTNTLQNIVKVTVAPRLTSDVAWYLLALGQSEKPFVLQTVQQARFAAQDAIEDERAFMRNEFAYGADWYGGAGFGLWQFAVGSDGVP